MMPSTGRNRAAHALLARWLLEQRPVVQRGWSKGDARLFPGTYAFIMPELHKNYSGKVSKVPPMQVDVLTSEEDATKALYLIMFSRLKPHFQLLFTVWARWHCDTPLLMIHNDLNADYNVVHMPVIFQTIKPIDVERPFIENIFQNEVGYR